MWIKVITYAALLSVSSSIFADFATKKEFQAALKKANAGNVEQMFQVSQLYQMGGYGFEANEKERLRWLDKAANTNYNPAIYEYVTHYYEKKKKKNALKWLQRGVANNHYESTYDLAMHYCNGTQVKQDLEKCVYLLQKIVNVNIQNYKIGEYDLGDYWAVVHGHVYLSTLYVRGLGTKKDLQTSNAILDHLITFFNYRASQEGIPVDRTYENISSSILQIGDKYTNSNGWGGFNYNPNQAKYFYDLGIYLGKNKAFRWDTSVFNERLATLARKK